MRPVRAVLAALVVLAVMLATASCVAPHNGLGTSSSDCFRGLPVADEAVHGHGRFVGVRKVSAETARDVLAGNEEVAAPSGTADEPTGRVCLFAFRGTFPEQSVDGASAASVYPGSYAVVAVTAREPRAIGAVVTDRLPLRFHHL